MNRVIILIPYPSDIGFAIGRLIRAFFDAACRVTGGADRVHFCFSDVSAGPCAHLPSSFTNVTGLRVFGPDASDASLLAQYVRANRINILIALDMQVQARILGPVRKAGIVRAVSYWGAPISSRNRGLKLLAKRAEVRLRRARPDLFIFESLAMRDLAISGRGVPEAETTVVPTGVDVSVFQPLPSKHTVYERFNIPTSRRIVVYMGHFHERKGIEILLRAADQVVVRHHRDDLHFLFLGTDERDLRALAHHFGESVTRGYVTFGGYHADVPALLAGCYVGCIPSSGWDSFPMSSLEMQACALPMVVSSLQGVPETIEEGVTGLVFPSGDATALADALMRLGDDTAQRDAMSQAARERIVKHFSVAHYVERLTTAIGGLARVTQGAISPDQAPVDP